MLHPPLHAKSQSCIMVHMGGKFLDANSQCQASCADGFWGKGSEAIGRTCEVCAENCTTCLSDKTHLVSKTVQLCYFVWKLCFSEHPSIPGVQNARTARYLLPVELAMMIARMVSMRIPARKMIQPLEASV